MAASSSLSSLSPKLLPTKTPPTQLTLPLSSFSLLSLSSSSPSPPPTLSQTLQFRDGLVPVVNPQESSQPSLSSDLLSVVCPALAFANMVFFKSGYNVQVIVGENEPEEKLISRFRRDVLRAGILQECKRRRFFETKQEERKRKTREAAKRNRKRRPPPKAPQQDKQVASSKQKGYNEEDDNWDFVDVEIPYCRP